MKATRSAGAFLKSSDETSLPCGSRRRNAGATVPNGSILEVSDMIRTSANRLAPACLVGDSKTAYWGTAGESVKWRDCQTLSTDFLYARTIQLHSTPIGGDRAKSCCLCREHASYLRITERRPPLQTKPKQSKCKAPARDARKMRGHFSRAQGRTVAAREATVTAREVRQFLNRRLDNLRARDGSGFNLGLPIIRKRSLRRCLREERYGCITPACDFCEKPFHVMKMLWARFSG